MFTETSVGENAGEIKEEASLIDPDFGVGKLSVSPVPYESFCLRADESSLTMLTSHVPAADVLLSAFDSISFVEDPKQTNNITKSTTETDAAGPICEPDLHGQRIEDGKAASKSDSSEFEVVNEIDQTQEPNNPLIVYTSSRRKSARSTNKKLNQNESPKPFRNCRRISKSNSALDLNSLKISRKKRSLFSKQARAAVWGVLENVVPAEEQIGLDPNLGDEKKQRRVRGGQGKRNNIKSQTDRKSAGQTYTSTGHISLKIKIGNQTFSTANVSENRNALEKSIPGLSDIKESKLVEELPRDMVLPRENASFCTSNDLHQIISHEEGDNLRVSTENRCSDPGTSPDSEVINSVPDARLFEKDLQTVQDGNIMPMEGTSQEQSTDTVPYPSFGDVSSLSLPRMKSKKGMKKDKQHLSGNCSVESKLNGAETTNNAKTPAEFGLGQKAVGVSYCNDASINATARPCLDAYNSNGEILIAHCNGQKSPKCSRGKGGRKSTSGISDLPSKKDKASKKKGAKSNLVSKHHIDETGDASGVLSGVESHLPAGNQIPSHHGATGEQSKGPSGPISGLQFSSDGISNQYVPPRNAWVLCDECQKWRRIPAILADRIEETNCGWTCEDNTDEEFADCSIAQEKSNSEINEELDISDASCEEDACDALQKSNKNQSKAAQQSSFSLIKSNLFRHRNRKTQTIDEVMVCHCKPPPDGRMGCGAKCLNRMLNIECVQGTCPCGELCSNQQFQKRTYAKLKWFRCGKKGFGLQALQDISSGQFLIEYVGEVLDVHAYEARQIEYAVQGHKHFYFMTLNGSEVIDASAKGNLGRFINHSCDPNCRTEKWMVNGEVCVGLFAVRDIKKGEEVTFDYNFVRVFGAAAKKCVCGSPNCRGYIGGDPTNSEVVQDDSDDEFAEPVMTCEDRDMNEEWNDIMSNCLYDIENVNANEPEENEDVGQFENFTPETLVQKVGGDSASASIDGCFKTPTATEVVDVMVQDKCEPADNDFASNAVTSLPCKLQPDTTEYKRKLKYGRQKEELLKSNPLVKTRSPSSSIKKGKLKSNVVNDKGTSNVDKSNAVVLQKSKKLPEVSVNSHVETVEDKLNELLDKEGGISKRKDASRGYLKLLFLTAASGTNGHGEAIQSNRDLSMILDALLKTKSRTVLVDITNKNGLQMLHNIMKRYRKEFIKTPILRKLLRVLEYLAMREILTLEHITGGPPCPGFESFKDSILTLTEHADKQVHQIARNFRDRWIPRSLRRSCFMDIDDGKSDIHQRSSYYGRLAASSHDHWSDRGGKPAESCSVEASSAPASASTSGTNQTRTRKRKSRWDNPDDDIPPGFSPPCNSSTVPFGTVLGNSQQRFAARIPLSYGVPFSVMQQFGVLQAENVALGLPFHPFPPLPPAEKAEQNEMMMSSRTGPPETNFSDQQDFQRDSYNLGRKYFRQQKWNNSKLAPPWVRMRNNGNQFRNSYNSEEFNRRGAEF